VFQKEGPLRLLTSQDLRRGKEDRSRLTGAKGSSIAYRVPATITEFQIDALAADSADLQILLSTDGQKYEQASPTKEYFTFGSNDYRFFNAIRYRLSSFPPATEYVKILLDGATQIGRVQYSYK